MRAWAALEAGVKRAVLVWHRRSGKDSLCLNWEAVACMTTPATYWHMLPHAEQARKAVWEAVDELTGERLIDRVFPREIRAVTRSNEMFIRFVNGSTWQLVGSDNYNSLVGSPPRGVTFSEFALAKPSAWDFIRPIVAHNGGWAIFNSTPRGRNHLHTIYKMALGNPAWFAQRLSVEDTGTNPALVQEERDSGMPEEMVQQEYYCSFEAALVGSYYGTYLTKVEAEGRIVPGLYDPSLPVRAVFDLGRTDDTAIWFFQARRGEMRLIDAHSSNNKDVPFYVALLRDKGYTYEDDRIYLPHDAKARTLAAPRSVEHQFRDARFNPRIVSRLSMMDGIQAARSLMPVMWFDADNCAEALEALRLYQRKWDADRKCFLDHPEHDWTSHLADAFRYAAIVFREEVQPEVPKPAVLYGQDAESSGMIIRPPTFNDAIAVVGRRGGQDYN